MALNNNNVSGFTYVNKIMYFNDIIGCLIWNFKNKNSASSKMCVMFLFGKSIKFTILIKTCRSIMWYLHVFKRQTLGSLIIHYVCHPELIQITNDN